MAEQREFQPTAECARNLQDLLLSYRVWGALARSPQARSAAIEVTARDGAVVITGSVGSAKAADAIPRIAEGVEGVRSLRCDVGVGTDWYW
jgi:osmotically-inducible protein OsmY